MAFAGRQEPYRCPKYTSPSWPLGDCPLSCLLWHLNQSDPYYLGTTTQETAVSHPPSPLGTEASESPVTRETAVSSSTVTREAATSRLVTRKTAVFNS